MYASGTDLGQSFFSPAQKDSKILDEYLIITRKRKAFSFLLEIQRKLSSARNCYTSKISQVYQWQLQS